jgi:hypothetical protein
MGFVARGTYVVGGTPRVARAHSVRLRASRHVTSRRVRPDRQLSESGHRFHSPELGRWLSRDPSTQAAADSTSNSNEELHPLLFLRNDPLSHADGLGLWLVGVHRSKTIQWAMLRGMPTSGATNIGEADNNVDTLFQPYPDIDENDWKYHFNRNASGLDSRLEQANDWYAIACILCDSRQGNDDWQQAGVAMGTALHPLQDIVAHGDFNRKTELQTPGNWPLLNRLELYHNKTAQNGANASQVDDPDLDAVVGTSGSVVAPDDGIPRVSSSGTGMVPGITRSGGQLYWSRFKQGSLRITRTRRDTEAYIDRFMAFVRSYGGCECRRNFLLVP